MSSLHIYNHKKDLPDHRDLKFEDFHAAHLESKSVGQPKSPAKSSVVKQVVVKPTIVDLRTSNLIPNILDQGQLGSCTANAASNALRYLLKKEKLKEWQPSRLYIYWFSRFLEDTTNEDSGCYIRDVMKAIHTYGACDEKLLPYNINIFKKRPSNSCVRNATPHIKNFKYLSVSNNDVSIKNCLNSGFPIVFGIDIYESFETEAVANSGIVPMPDINNEQLLGGHCVCIYGYNETTKQYIVMNSWGSKWGDKGFFYLPYDYVHKYGSDLWVLNFFD